MAIAEKSKSGKPNKKRRFLPPPPACTAPEFLEQIGQHRMRILLDDGVRRHIEFQAKSGSWRGNWFDLLTWPGFLAICGSMGVYVFSRTEDMFTIFRPSHWRGLSRELRADDYRINPHYWAQKMRGIDREGFERWDPETFQSRVMGRVAGRPEITKETRDALYHQVIQAAEDGEFFATYAAMTFEHNGFRLSEWYEAKCTEYTFSYLWSLYAIVWGIRQYDQSRERELRDRIAAFKHWGRG